MIYSYIIVELHATAAAGNDSRMHLLRAATLTVADVSRSVEVYAEWLDYEAVEEGEIDEGLARSWGSPASAGRRYAVMRPASGEEIYLRFVAGDPVPDYRPLRSYGWNAIELCVTDVLEVAERMEGSPFEIIGPPREIEGLDAIYPMQVEGPDREIVYLTQIRSDLPAYTLPRASTLVDHLFILVLGCSDLDASLEWFERAVGLETGRRMDIVYTMLAKAYATPEDELHTIATMVHGKDVFLELDQYPDAAVARPARDGALPPGVAMATLKAPDFAAVQGVWIEPPRPHGGVIYGGALAGTLRAPDDTLVELVSTH